MPGDGSGRNITVRMPDEGTLQTVRTILAYESAVRGRKAGQTLAELVMEAVDIESYPPEVRARLDELAEQHAQRAVEKFLQMDAGSSGDSG